MDQTRKAVAAAKAINPEVAPYKILPGAFDAVNKVVRGRLELFSARGAGAGR